MEQRFKFQDSEGRRVSAVLLSPSVRTDKVVILCHGFMGHKDSVTNRMLSDHLARQSISTLRFDFFGHGQSDGDIKDLLLTTIVAQTESALSLMQGHGFTRVGLLGSSFGGLVATLVAAKAPVLAALALRCPVADFPVLLRQKFGRAAIDLWRRLGRVPPTFGHIPMHFRFFEDCERHDAFRAAQKLRVPTTIVHGDQDDVIPVTQARDLYAQIPAEKALHIMAGADHRFSDPKQFSRMTGLLMAWLTRYLAIPTPAVG